MRNIDINDLASQMSAQSDFFLTEVEAKAFIKASLSTTLEIIKRSKGRIIIRGCDLLQAYKKVNFEEMQLKRMDVNEVEITQDTIRPYSS